MAEWEEVIPEVLCARERPGWEDLNARADQKGAEVLGYHLQCAGFGCFTCTQMLSRGMISPVSPD